MGFPVTGQRGSLSGFAVGLAWVDHSLVYTALEAHRVTRNSAARGLVDEAVISLHVRVQPSLIMYASVGGSLSGAQYYFAQRSPKNVLHTRRLGGRHGGLELFDAPLLAGEVLRDKAPHGIAFGGR